MKTMATWYGTVYLVNKSQIVNIREFDYITYQMWKEFELTMNTVQ